MARINPWQPPQAQAHNGKVPLRRVKLWCNFPISPRNLGACPLSYYSIHSYHLTYFATVSVAPCATLRMLVGSLMSTNSRFPSRSMMTMARVA